MSAKQDEAWSRIKSYVYANDAAEADANYTKYAKVYEKDQETLKGLVHNTLVRITLQHCNNNKDTLLLDAAAGTGLCGESLLKHGYKGTMDALEINAAMLKEAEKKSIYRKHIQCGIFPDKPLPIDEGTYDGVICSGAFLANHIEQGSVLPMTKVLRPGGIFVLNSRMTPQNDDYRHELEKVIEEQTKIGKVESVTVEDSDAYHSNSPETGKVMKYRTYILRRVR